VNLLWFTQATASAPRHIDSLPGGDYLTRFGLDRCCEELAEITALADDLGTHSDFARLVQHTYRRVPCWYGPVECEPLAVAVLEEQAGLRIDRARHHDLAGPGHHVWWRRLVLAGIGEVPVLGPVRVFGRRAEQDRVEAAAGQLARSSGRRAGVHHRDLIAAHRPLHDARLYLDEV
jgi:hypothetical protein